MEFDFLYDSTALTGLINRVPNRFGLVGSLGIFASEGIGSTKVELREEEGSLTVLNHRPRGSGAQVNERKRGKTRVIQAGHFELEDLITPQDVQDRLAVIGREKTPEAVEDLVAKLLIAMANKHYITLEWNRVGALSGIVLDGDGTTELVNLFDEFGITEKEVNFALDTSTTKVLEKCEEVTDHIGQNLKGETMTMVEGICGTTYFNKFVQHANVEKYYQNWQAAAALASPDRNKQGGNWGRTFEFGGLRLIEYKGTAPLSTGSSTPFVGASQCRFYPVGTTETFATYFAPPDTLDAANALAELHSDPDFGGEAQMFASPDILKHGKGVEIYTESNPISICRRPELLVKGIAA